ncbi:class I SAM-dependent RNA methyltransferase [Magnetospirillum sulfuroxidans]|uniref:Class I SAM-dependent RNA methyltransferase n=1 Tax=Magnetospirillum sulfuroxidans TaxID=611300 RepID=A0ABS5IAC2_9PROT|nr:class I SAM-dependent RNA methyltransferase [Magnetospirillum sulfuroxidans]MBR9971284.1 class I SAM-dependent RNA methyltransferase [Magnetospirillum sulfuroxidans]
MIKRKPARSSNRAKPRSTPPPRNVEVEITEIGARGDGVARLGDDLVFVPFTVPGDRAVARIEGRRGDGLAASLIEVTQSGPGRAVPPCPQYGRCGGCSLQHLDDLSYAEWKRGLLITQLARHGLGEVPVAPMLRVATGSRRRAAFAFHRRKGSTVLGFNARASHTIIDLDDCLLLDRKVVAIIAPLRAILTTTVAEGEDGDVVVNLSENGLDLLIEADARLDLFDREKLAAFADSQNLARLSWRRPGAGFIEPIARRQPALLHFAAIAVEPPPGNFLQPTEAGEKAIARLVVDGVGKAKTVADLYCGCGSFTFPLASTGATLHAVEGDEAPLLSLETSANHAGLKITTETRDLARRPLLAHELKKFQAVVFDPPRAGAQAQAEHLAEAGPAVVVAVSCNPATLARDLAILVKGGYGVETITPIDQFPHSAHLEAVAVLRK